MPLKAFSTRMRPHTVTLRAVAHDVGPRGGDDATPAAGSTLACRVLVASDGERSPQPGAVFGRNRFEIRFASDPGLTTDDRIDWGDHVLSVLAPATPMDSVGRSYRLFAIEVD